MDEVEGQSPSDVVEELKERLATMRKQALFLKFHKKSTAYDDFILALESAEFYLDRLALPETVKELGNAEKSFKG